MVLNIMQHKVDSYLVIMTRRMRKMTPANAQIPPIKDAKDKWTISSVSLQNWDFAQHLYSHLLNDKCARKTSELFKSLNAYTDLLVTRAHFAQGRRYLKKTFPLATN